MLIEQDDLLCGKCGSVIPSNKQILEEWERAKIQAEKAKCRIPDKPIGVSSGLIACAGCARAASEGMSLNKKQSWDKNHPDQEMIPPGEIFVS